MKYVLGSQTTKRTNKAGLVIELEMQNILLSLK